MASEKNLTEDAVLDTDHAELRVYELGFHLDPELPETEAKKTYQAIRDRIAESGSIIAEGEPTKIPLAYTISRTETTQVAVISTAHSSAGSPTRQTGQATKK
jgi:hypothetical protein